MSRRTERVAEQVRAELARALREDSTDPRLRLVTLTRVDVSPDLSRADVFWSVAEGVGAPQQPDSERALDRAAGFLRHALARTLPLRRVPSLHFHHDPSLALGDRTLGLLRELRGDSEG